MTAERKKDARAKFLLGGLVVRAGLSKADRAFLLGGLIELAQLSPDASQYLRLRSIGERAFKLKVSSTGYDAVLEDTR
ncbi:conjugal transfer protein TraD [Ochrobactrum sp. MYb379]|uniref:conjugal transfer protein TraD n=1 Tax=Ochrobactrum sp. MYb379 TaxID=2745275 RepID=UPI0030B3ADE1